MNRIASTIEKKAGNKFKFIPDKDFYQTIEIGRKRWAQIYRNEKSVTLDELTRIANYFEVSVHDLIQENND